MPSATVLALLEALRADIAQLQTNLGNVAQKVDALATGQTEVRQLVSNTELAVLHIQDTLGTLSHG